MRAVSAETEEMLVQHREATLPCYAWVDHLTVPCSQSSRESSPMEVMLLLWWGQLQLSSCSTTKELARTNTEALAVAEGL